MVVKKPRIVIIGAGMAGLTAANKLYKTGGSEELFELCVVEGGNRIGGRINTSEFGGARIEVGATWIHGIVGSPIHKIAQEINSLESEQPWECMDGFLDDPLTIAENGYELSPSLVDPITNLFKKLMEFAQGKPIEGDGIYCILESVGNWYCDGKQQQSVGSFLRRGLEAYWESRKGEEEVKGYGNWSRKLLEEAIFAMHENTQRTYTSANVLSRLDYNAESEYRMFPGEEITIAKGYLSIIESLASVLPSDVIQLGKIVSREWQPAEVRGTENDVSSQPVKLYFDDGTTMSADHVILTVSLGVLKAGISESGMFNPSLPSFKTQAISRLGFRVVKKLFLQLSQEKGKILDQFPFLQLVFHQSNSELKHPKIPWWIRRTASFTPIYSNSRVLLSWFTGEEALQLESMKDEEIISGVSTTISTFLSKSRYRGNPDSQDSHEYCKYYGNPNSHEYCNKGNGNENESYDDCNRNENGNGNSIERRF